MKKDILIFPLLFFLGGGDRNYTLKVIHFQPLPGGLTALAASRTTLVSNYTVGRARSAAQLGGRCTGFALYVTHSCHPETNRAPRLFGVAFLLQESRF